MKLTVIAVTWWHPITDNDFLWDLLSPSHRHFHSNIQCLLVKRGASVQSCTMRSQVICIHWITQINSLTVHEWSGSYLVQGQSFDLEVTLQYGLLLTFLRGSQQVLKHQRPYWCGHETDKSRTKYKAGYVGLNSADFPTYDLKGAGVLEALRCVLPYTSFVYFYTGSWS